MYTFINSGFQTNANAQLFEILLNSCTKTATNLSFQGFPSSIHCTDVLVFGIFCEGKMQTTVVKKWNLRQATAMSPFHISSKPYYLDLLRANINAEFSLKLICAIICVVYLTSKSCSIISPNPHSKMHSHWLWICGPLNSQTCSICLILECKMK